MSKESTPELVFSGSPRGLELFRAVERMLAASTPPATRATKSQVAFRGRRGYAYVWWPGRYLASEVPAVLSIALPRRIDSARFKEVVNPSPGLWMHHLELHNEEELDAEVAEWLREARAAAD
ncbi:DUF5655 domain-containing protein [Arthrobacter sp. PsM3]|uniref:DUF5655 domain-containing protein n=1 Tax=Arthrobacter sp. PsM3 TaxID=3030531 RepID=UPI00263A75F2|nr:DUF5655 domain-containing protein [Arthrobacter sp. PsM3]MDN4646347.1 DUF5655 domain-containing protein [Arthrobacter sp. PsM3]